MEIQTTGDNSAAENMQVLQVLLELVHPQGGTIQVERDAENIPIQVEGVDGEQLQNAVSSISTDLNSDNIVISYNGVQSTLGSLQSQLQQQQQQLEAAGVVAAAAAGKLQDASVYDPQLNENVVLQITGQAENVGIPITSVATTTATTPQASIVEIPILNATPRRAKKDVPAKKDKGLSVEDMEEKYQYECTLCKKLCKSQRALEKHMEKELKVKPHVCEVCEKRFKNIGGLQNHRKLHTGEKPFKCETCDVSFTNRSTFNYHNEKKHSDKVHVCQCSKTFKTKACLRAHLKNHTFQGPKRYKCQYCGLRLRTKHYKNEHERIHTNERPFKCREGCDKAFRRSGARNDHERTVHLKQNKQACKFCGHCYDKREIKNHEMVHTGQKPFACPYCESKYTQRKVLNKHIRRKHPDEDVPAPPKKEKLVTTLNTAPQPDDGKSPEKKSNQDSEPKDKPADASAPTTIQIQVYRCMYCVKLFNNINHLTEHEKTHIKEHNYQCGTCGKTFQRPEGLTRHEGKHAGGFQCFTCGKWFQTLTKMQEHQREHFHRCTLCRRKFLTKDKLDEHMKRHKAKDKGSESTSTSSSAPASSRLTHQCKYCSKSFLREVGLKEHERIHLEKIKCPLCTKTFVSYYLEKHLRTHSGDHPYLCSLCPNRHYTTPKALRTHMRRRHPVQKIEIKHKKGSKKAMIQVSEKPEDLDALVAEVARNRNIQITHEGASANDAADESLPNLDAGASVSQAEVPCVHMEGTSESAGDPQTSQQLDTAPAADDEQAGTTEILVPISSVIQQAAAANNIVVSPQTVVNQDGEQQVQLVSEDGTIQALTITDTLAETQQKSSTMISEMDTEDGDASSALQDGVDSQTEQETIIMREIDPSVTLESGNEQIVFTFS